MIRKIFDGQEESLWQEKRSNKNRQRHARTCMTLHRRRYKLRHELLLTSKPADGGFSLLLMIRSSKAFA